MIGKVIGNYEVLEKLGQGGMGTVFKARDPRLRRLVALKFLSDPDVDANARARFQREAQAASSLSHPNIVAIYDIGEHRIDERHGADYIVMEYIEGSPLNKLIPARGLPAAEALDYLLQIGDALQAADAAGVVHRDLKPGNVIVDRAGTRKGSGFRPGEVHGASGFRRHAAHAADQSRRFRGDHAIHLARTSERRRRRSSFRHFFLCGDGAGDADGPASFFGASQWALLHEIAHGKPRPLRETHPHLPPSLEQLILQMLAKQPRDRIGGMKEVLVRLREIREQVEDIEPTRILTQIGEGSTPADHSLSAEPSSSVNEKASIAVMMFRSLSPDKDDQYLAEGIASEIVRALSGASVALSAR